MTPEEQFIMINNTLQTVTENQARNELQIEKNSAGIRDLIMVSRTCLDSIQQLTAAQRETDLQIGRLREAQSKTEEKLNALIGTVDRIIRRDNGKQSS